MTPQCAQRVSMNTECSGIFDFTEQVFLQMNQNNEKILKLKIYPKNTVEMLFLKLFFNQRLFGIFY